VKKIFFLAVPDGKVRELAGGGKFSLIDALDVSVHSLLDRFDDVLDFSGRSFHHQFDAAIREIADVSGHVVTDGDVPGGVSESHALNSAVEMIETTMNLGFNHRLGHGVNHIQTPAGDQGKSEIVDSFF
jgi:hypothetical protein